jgi:4-amino-4-deoxy-L-arabinose transferase-like glycosyltransferase
VMSFALATVLLVGLLGTRLGGRATGIAAATLVAVLPIFVTRSSVVIVDTPATFFATATLYCAARFTVAGRTRALITWVALAGAASGFAFATKYTVGVVLLSVFAVIALRRDLSIARTLALAAAGAGAFVASAVIAMPALVLRVPEVIDAFRFQERRYARGVTPSYLHELSRPVELGWLLLLVGLIGLGVLLSSRRARPVTIGFLAFAIPSLPLFLRSSYQPLRNLLPMMPFLAIAMAATVVWAVRFVGGRLRLGPVAQGVGAVAIVGVLCVSPFEAGTKRGRTSARTARCPTPGLPHDGGWSATCVRVIGCSSPRSSASCPKSCDGCAATSSCRHSGFPFRRATTTGSCSAISTRPASLLHGPRRSRIDRRR